MIVTPAPPPPASAVVEPLAASVSVSLTTTEKTALSDAAKTAGLSMSAWARRAILAAL